MPHVYHLSPNNFDQFSPSRFRDNFPNASNRLGVSGVFFATNFKRVVDWAGAVAYSKGDHDKPFERLIKKREKLDESDPKKFEPIRKDSQPQYFRSIYVYEFYISPQYYRKIFENAKKNNLGSWEPEIFVPFEDIDKLTLVSKKRYKTHDLLGMGKKMRITPKEDDKFFQNEQEKNEQEKYNDQKIHELLKLREKKEEWIEQLAIGQEYFLEKQIKVKENFKANFHNLFAPGDRIQIVEINDVDGAVTINTRRSDGKWHLKTTINVLWDSIKKDIVFAKNIKWYKTAILNKNILHEISDFLEYEKFSEDGIAQKLNQLGINFEKIKFPEAKPVIIFNEYIIELDPDYPVLKEKHEWIWDINDFDLTNYIKPMETNFWNGVSEGSVAYHATDCENIDIVLKEGLIVQSKTRGISNRTTGPAVFASFNKDSISSYGDCILEINLGAMKKDGYLPNIAQEEGMEENELRSALAHKIRAEDFYIDEEPGVDPETIVIFEGIPAKYLKLHQNSTNYSRTKQWYKISKKTPEYLYHGTTQRALRKIITEGIVPTSDNQVSLSSDELYAQSYANRKGGSRGIMLRIKYNESFLPDTRIVGGGEYMSLETIPPSNIDVKMSDGTWVNLALIEAPIGVPVYKI